MSVLASVKPVGEGKEAKFAIIVGDREIGTSKLQCDAQLWANVINTAHDHVVASAEQHAHSEGYQEGYRVGYREGKEDGAGENA